MEGFKERELVLVFDEKKREEYIIDLRLPDYNILLQRPLGTTFLDLMNLDRTNFTYNFGDEFFGDLDYSNPDDVRHAIKYLIQRYEKLRNAFYLFEYLSPEIATIINLLSSAERKTHTINYDCVIDKLNNLNHILGTVLDPGFFTQEQAPRYIKVWPTKINNEGPYRLGCVLESDLCGMRFFSRAAFSTLGIELHCCEYCGKTFIPSRKGNTKYCSNIMKGETRPCSEIGPQKAYQQKVKESPVDSIYRTAYIRIHARMRKKKISTEEFLIWADQAKAKKEAVKEGVLSLEEYEKWLKG